MELFVLEKFAVINYVAQNCIVIQERQQQLCLLFLRI